MANLSKGHSNLGLIYLELGDSIASKKEFEAFKNTATKMTKKFPSDNGLKTRHAMSLAIYQAMCRLTHVATNANEMTQAKLYFQNAYKNGRQPRDKILYDFIAKMDQPGADLKKVVIEMCMFWL